ncbi:MAG: hypothetical protein WAN30_09625 [Acidimicrobiales bacterium]
MIDAVPDLYDYAALRTLKHVTVFVPQLVQPLIVLGGSQSSEVLSPSRDHQVALRRRRGGGGLVVLAPGDVWVDWWIPSGDPRWSGDVRASSRWCGELWRDTLMTFVDDEVTVHEGPLDGDEAHRVICFAGRGPGEVFIAGRKAVGVTQWRVREGVFLSSVWPAHDSKSALALLRVVPEGLAQALDRQEFASGNNVRPDEIVASLVLRTGASSVRRPNLLR